MEQTNQSDDITFLDLAVHYLQTEQLVKINQLTTIISQQQKLVQNSLRISHKIFLRAFQNIEEYLTWFKFAYETGQNSKGNYIAFPYEAFAKLNRECNTEMEIMYSAEAQEFHPEHVRIYQDIHQALPEDMIQRYKHWKA
ncbi:hypothetical protein [Eisenibacter elegans]|jgi:hypothetical protein|uniref:hypothetical protein n=1 Tax=Eisenibacter elegans TaxID=997 RepID=UPI0004246648|nr:hypothetical protein [Eisenibacter elegans]